MQPASRKPAGDLVELGLDTFTSDIYSNIEVDEQLGSADELQQTSIDLAPKVSSQY